MNAKRIMHIAEASGGVERFLVSLLTKLKAYPQFEHILVCSASFERGKFEGLVKALEVIPSMRHDISFIADAKAVLAVRRAIRAYKPDMVFCHSSKAGAIGRLADIGIRNRRIYNAHGWAFNMKGAGNQKIRLYTLAEKMLATVTDRIVCISAYEKESALAHKIGKERKLAVINNGIDFEEFRTLNPKSREALGIPMDAFVVGTIGRLTPQKAPDVFIQMAKTVKEKIPSAFFLMVGDDIGDGHFRAETQKWIQEAGLEGSVLITGWVDDPLDYGCLFDAAVLLSRWEGFGLVLPEYMYMGKPIVATKADAIPCVVGDAGLLVDIDDARQAAESIVRLYEDQELRNRLIARGKLRAKQFNVQRTAEEYARMFQTLFQGV